MRGLSLLLPDSLDFLVSGQDGISIGPGERRGQLSRMSPFEAGSRNLFVVGPGDERNISVLDADGVERFGGRSSKKRTSRGFMEKHVQECLLLVS